VPRKRNPQPADRPQTSETWAVGAVQLRVWITPEDEPPHRPFVVMVLDLDHDFILGNDMFAQAPTPDEVFRALRNVIRRPAPGTGRPRRPERILFDDPALTEALAAPLAELNIACETQPLPMLAEIVRGLEAHLRGGEPEHPGMLSVEGVTPELVGELFAAAGEFYRAAPWVPLTNGQAFALRFPAEGGPEWIASVMGNGGVEYGIALYKSWPVFEAMFLGEADDPRELLAAEGHVALMFGDISKLALADYDVLEQYHWEVADEQAYPLVIVLQAGAEPVRRPSRAELRFLIAALRAVPRVLRDHLRPDDKGDYAPLSLTLSVSVEARDQRVAVRYPAGEIALERRAVQQPNLEFPDDGDEGDETDDLPIIDRRMMEGMMAQLGADLGDEGIADPKLRKAQKLMYKAWEESNPAKRLNLAHKALATSPDCADAYVLLAEEEADTLARAEAYYQKGVEAGERALGSEYFRENQGHFWGLLETRPYMRAREGLANTLWALNHREAAVEHYRALLELNPGDNQGVRYSLLNLLLEMGRGAEVVALLKQYDDAMAEWLYTWALVEFRQSGPGKAADRRLKAALKQNKHVPAYLTGRKRIPNQLPPYMGWGDEAEAMHYAHRYLNHWRRTAGAVEWLKSKV
jgi:tetratricopeptide (TPR) repeat protein